MENRPFGRFSARDRLRKRSEFERVRELGRRVVTANFVFLLRREGSGNPRLGITASRRVGNAPERNRAKRLVREAFRATRAFWPPGAEVVVIVRGGLGARRLGDVLSEWQSAQNRLTRCFAQLGSSRSPGEEAGAPRARVTPVATEHLSAKKSC